MRFDSTTSPGQTQPSIKSLSELFSDLGHLFHPLEHA